MYKYKTQGGVCSSYIEVELEGNIVKSISVKGGCNGNLKGICRVATGKTVEEIEELFLGITCGMKSSSCPDQISKAVRMAYESLCTHIS